MLLSRFSVSGGDNAGSSWTLDNEQFAHFDTNGNTMILVYAGAGGDVNVPQNMATLSDGPRINCSGTTVIHNDFKDYIRYITNKTMKFVRVIIFFQLGFAIFNSLSVGNAEEIYTNGSGTPAASVESKKDVNGIYAEVSIPGDESSKPSQKVSVWIYNTNQDGFFGAQMPEDPHDALSIARKIESGTLLYYRPPNLFCGPIELRDAAGAKVSCKKVEFVTAEAYPASFSFSEAKKLNSNSSQMLPSPLVRTPELLGSFSLTNFFNIATPARYQLTVWPKIYKRSSTNDDVCLRIDLLPITTTVTIEPTSTE